MTEEKLLQQAEIDALLKAGGQEQGSDPDPQSQPPDLEATPDEQDQGTLGQADIDALLKAGGQEQGSDPDAESQPLDLEATPDEQDQGTLGQADIDALLNAGPDQVLFDADLQNELSTAEKDALGEVGNISMGAAATTLSQLLNRRVDITSPKVQITQQKDFIASFKSPFLIIQVQFKEGFTGYNVLVIKLHDAKVMADLMMGGDGTNLPEEITEMEISAAAEAMNQMIGTSSTALADLMSRSVNIAPPEVVVVREIDHMKVDLPFTGPLVVIFFDLKIKDLLDTSIMQVIDIPSAHEQAQALLSSFGLLDEATIGEPFAPDQEPQPMAPTQELVQDTRAEMASPSELRGRAPEPPVPPVPLQDEMGMTQVDTQKLNLLLDIPLKVSVVLGRTKKSIKEVLSMTPGAIAELETMVEEPVDVLVNGKLVAKGEVVVVNENFGVKITSIISTSERINSLGS